MVGTCPRSWRPSRTSAMFCMSSPAGVSASGPRPHCGALTKADPGETMLRSQTGQAACGSYFHQLFVPEAKRRVSIQLQRPHARFAGDSPWVGRWPPPRHSLRRRAPSAGRPVPPTPPSAFLSWGPGNGLVPSRPRGDGGLSVGVGGPGSGPTHLPTHRPGHGTGAWYPPRPPPLDLTIPRAGFCRP